MNRRCIGGVFCILAVLLFITKFIVYAIVISSIFSTGVYSWRNIINDLYPYVDKPLNTASYTLLILGICFLIYAELKESKIEKK